MPLLHDAVIVIADDPPNHERQFRYNPHHLQHILQLMGCKHLHAIRITEAVFSELTPNDQPQRLSHFFQLVGEVLTELGYSWKLLELDFQIARKVKDQQQPLCILLGGTSGCGKSTLGSLLASRLGITTVLSTDTIRHLARSFVSEAESPLLWASSYHAGEALASSSSSSASNANTELVIAGYEAQSRLLFQQISDIIGRFEERGESLIIEGVHLSVSHMVELTLQHPCCIPFLIYISNEAKHTERFAIRAKYMALEPRLNKYVKYFSNIRIIQDYLCRQADISLIPKIDNTNVDRSLAIIHHTVFTCLRYNAGVETLDDGAPIMDGTRQLIDPVSKQAFALNALHRRIEDRTRGSKEMLQFIRQKKRSVSDPEPANRSVLIGEEEDTIDDHVGEDALEIRTAEENVIDAHLVEQSNSLLRRLQFDFVDLNYGSLGS